MTRSSSLFRTGLAGLVGCLIGTYYERNWSSSNGFRPQSAIHLTESRVQPIPVKIEQVAPASKNRYRPNLEHIQPDHARILSIMQHGFPSIDGLRQFDNFVLSYDRRHRNANWVFEHLTPANLSGEQQPKSQKANRMDFEFFEDLQIHEYFRSSNNDFKRSGYDRGHLAPAGNYKFSQRDCSQTFVLSNISPQVGPGFNRGIWNKLEQYVRYRTNGSKQLWVVTGPLYLPQPAQDGRSYVMYEVIGPNNVAVPTHFFKVLLIENRNGDFELECYMMANKPINENLPLKAFQVPLDSIERASGLRLFEKMPKERLKSINGPNPFLSKFDQPKKRLF